MIVVVAMRVCGEVYGRWYYPILLTKAPEDKKERSRSFSFGGNENNEKRKRGLA
jgi:hypothetical protein